MREVEGPRGCLSCPCCSELFYSPKSENRILLRYALDAFMAAENVDVAAGSRLQGKSVADPSGPGFSG